MKILIIGPSWVGDCVVAQTLYKRLKDEEPSCTIDVISPEWSLPLLQRMPEVSKVIKSSNTTSSSPYTLTGLTSSTSYEWRVKCQGTPWAGTPINTFTTGASYSYLWSDGQTTQTANNLIAGNYTCDITDANGCIFTTSQISIINPSALTAPLPTITNVNCFGGSDGTATVNTVGGTPFTTGALPNSPPIHT